MRRGGGKMRPRSSPYAEDQTKAHRGYRHHGQIDRAEHDSARDEPHSKGDHGIRDDTFQGRGSANAGT